MRVLNGHNSAETAYVVNDYPYGFRLRCQMRVWIERKPGKGSRYVTQTSNPKRPGTWNRPKASTYQAISLMVLDESNNYVNHIGLSEHAWAEEIRKFRAEYSLRLCSEDKETLDRLEQNSRQSSPDSWKNDDESHAQVTATDL